MTMIKTPTRMVEITLIDPKTGLDWSGDYIGNTVGDGDGDDDVLHLDRDATDAAGRTIYAGSDDCAEWWIDQCARQQDADDALADLDAAARERVDALLTDGRMDVDMEHHPDVVMAAIAEALGDE
jgi:hypothetical protein